MKTYMRLIMCAVLMLSFVGVMPNMVGVAGATPYDDVKAARDGIKLIPLEDYSTINIMKTEAVTSLDKLLDPPQGYWKTPDTLEPAKGEVGYLELIEVVKRLKEILEALPVGHIYRGDINIAIGYICLAAEGIAQKRMKEVEPELRIPRHRKEMATNYFAQGVLLRDAGKHFEAIDYLKQAWRAVTIGLAVQEMLRGLEVLVRARQLGGIVYIEAGFKGIGDKISSIVVSDKWEIPDKMVLAKRAEIARGLAEVFEDAKVLEEDVYVPESDRNLAKSVIDVLACSVARHADKDIERAVAEGVVQPVRIERAKTNVVLADEKFKALDTVGAFTRYLLTDKILGLR